MGGYGEGVAPPRLSK